MFIGVIQLCVFFLGKADSLFLFCSEKSLNNLKAKAILHLSSFCDSS